MPLDDTSRTPVTHGFMYNYTHLDSFEPLVASGCQRGLDIDAACLPSSSDNGELQTKERFTVTDFLPTFSAITLFSSNLESSSDFKGTWQWVRALIDSGFLRSDRVMHNRTPGAGGSRVLSEKPVCAHCTVFYLKRYLEGVSTEKKKKWWANVLILWETSVKHFGIQSSSSTFNHREVWSSQ